MRILFFSANCVVDPSSGAAISLRTILNELGRQGHIAASFGGTIFDVPPASSSGAALEGLGARPTSPDDPVGSAWLIADENATHHVVPMARLKRQDQSRSDEERIAKLGVAFVRAFRPDIFITYGAGLCEKLVTEAARGAGVKTVFYLANPGYKRLASFDYIDQVVTDTQATTDLYRERLGLQAVPIGKFVAPPALPDESGPRDRVTFVNPAPEKGVTLFYRIAELAARVAPQLKFLVVESRATLAAATQRTGMTFTRFNNVETVGMQKQMGRVFARTRILLQPSLWHESGGRVAIEAASLGIPMVVSDRGGLPEVLRGAGLQISPPLPLIENHWLIPPPTAAIPWVEALRSLDEDPAFYAEHSAAARASWQAHDPVIRTRELVHLFEAILARHA